MLHEGKIYPALQRRDVGHPAGRKIVNTDDYMAGVNQQSTKVRAQKSGPPGDNNSFTLGPNGPILCQRYARRM
ncbi:hypothetical protein [Roseovarius gahaiensis]|uniref:hypothetical protein n=1 Tax=Roseovarius gahaiensis TaxID=2716691 RepID=UPI002F2B58AD